LYNEMPQQFKRLRDVPVKPSARAGSKVEGQRSKVEKAVESRCLVSFDLRLSTFDRACVSGDGGC